MIQRLGLCALLLGVVLRLLALDAHEFPRGDVVLDVAVARSLAQGDGFASGFERALAKLPGPDAPRPAQDRADQHAPLWPLVGASGRALGVSPFAALRWASWLAGLGLLLLVWRMADRLLEGLVGAPDGLACLASACVGLSFVAVDAAGNGSLYGLQALLVLLLVEGLAAARVSWLRTGLVLGALCLLNHQCLVLVVVPPAVLLLAAAPGDRLRAVRVSALALGVAALCQLPWWMRNMAVFGNPLHSVNSIYFLYRAGVPMSFAVEAGFPVLRFEHGLGLADAVRASVGFLRPNALYVMATGLAVWPVLLGPAVAGGPGLLLEAVRGRDRRLLGLVVATAALAAVAVLWPATKLRFLVVLVPLLVLLASRVLARPPGAAVRRGAAVLCLLWLAAVGLTLDDVLGDAPDARPLRWVMLAVGGALLVGWPLLAWLRGRVSGPGLMLASLAVSFWLALAVPLGPGPGTAYGATSFAPDFFGQAAEVVAERAARGEAAAHDVLLERGLARVAGPVGLAAWGEPALVEMTRGLPPDMLAASLLAYIDAGKLDGVVLHLADARGLAGFQAEPGAAVLEGRLRVEAVTPDDAAQSGLVVLRVQP